AFPVGSAYFTGNRANWEEFKFNLSFLAGQPDVAFRFVFIADDNGSHAGVALDDVTIQKYEGELVTKLLNFTGSFPNGENVRLDWNTQPEYYCRQFEVERSVNGRDFERIATVNATGILTTALQSYQHTSLALKNLYFYRLRVINENEPTGYNHVFYSPIVVMQRRPSDALVNRVFPGPFGNTINVTFNGNIEKTVEYELFDIAGRLVQRGKADNPGVFLSIDTGARLAKGAYVLRLRESGGTFETFKLAGGW
ncbi:MAG TPA: T9SS type A sorting domain-containing protein, partial [Saprospiraceae bacterium]|nr:T9SS type A sorting domain-containing protein [Saprospiraceae bacterium]